MRHSFIQTTILVLLLTALCDTAPAQDQERARRFGRSERRDRPEFGRPRGDGRFGGGADGSDRSRRFDPIARLDANSNGIVDQEEIDRIPDHVKGMMKARGFYLEAGESTDKVRERTRRQFEEARRRWSKDRDESSDRPDKSGDSGRDNRSTPALPFRPRDRERITVDIPTTYQESDTDLDGQIGLYEWIVSRRDDLEMFDDIDRDGDGLLTPREMVAWEKSQSDAGKQQLTVKRERLVIVGTAESAASPDGERRGTESKSDRRDDKDRTRNYASSVFERMDRDGDGRLSLDEWGRSRRIRPWFEQQGIAIREMTEKQFTATFTKLSRDKQKRD